MNAIEFLRSKGFNVVESNTLGPDEIKIVNKQDILIRLLKEGHISEDEFKVMYEPETILTTNEIVDLYEKWRKTPEKPFYSMSMYYTIKNPIKKNIGPNGEEFYTVS